jgi:hypothetical protein
VQGPLGTTVPWRANKSPILTTVRPAGSQW